MNKRKIIRTDFLVQAILFACTVVSVGIWLALGSSNYMVCVVIFLMLLSWQFFSGIYIAAELGRWYRGALPMLLLVGLVVSILLLAFGIPMGIFAAFGLAPVIAIANFVVGLVDFRQYQESQIPKKIGDERILDSGDLF